jgi:ADP-ribosyl-[dinitrogen reductase] hydrolase
MTLVMGRVVRTVVAFIEEHGTWPTMLIVPVENWLEYRKDARTISDHFGPEAARAILGRVRLVPVPLQKYIAIDDAGNHTDYDRESWPQINYEDLLGLSTREPRSPRRPIENSYVVPESALVAGEYPGSDPSVPATIAESKLAAFLDAGITAFIDLTDPLDRLEPYRDRLQRLAAARGVDVKHQQLTIRDNHVCDAAQMRRILDTIDRHIENGRAVYVHCWGGIGRTGMVVGCWMVRHGRRGEDALLAVNDLFRTMSSDKVAKHSSWGSPQTEAQRTMVRNWNEPFSQGISTLDRYRGAMLGLAVGDALGTTLEFKKPGKFKPIDDIVGGGPFGLAAGQWTDDTSMALCLAESLLECSGFNAVDQMRRYVRWVDEGHWSSTGRCFDCGSVVSRALSRFRRSGDGFSGPVEENTAGNGSLMRLAPVPLFYGRDAALAVQMAADSSRTTHGVRAAVDACRYFAGLIVGALAGVPKRELLSAPYEPARGIWKNEPLQHDVERVADGSFLRRSPPQIRGGSGYVIDTLEAALWAFATTDDFRSGSLAAVNLGGDADTTGAVYGQLAGAHYGVDAIPAAWRERITFGTKIDAMARELHRAAGWEA